MTKESLAKVWESTTKATSTAKTLITAKALRKEKKQGRKAKEKDEEKTRSQRQIRVSNATANHVANGGTSQVSVGKDTCKRWSLSSSASLVAPSAVTTPAAGKTTVTIQEFNDEQEPGWILGVMGGSVASVTTG